MQELVKDKNALFVLPTVNSLGGRLPEKPEKP